MKDTARTVLTEAGINVDTALKRFLDDEEMYFEFLNSFVEDTLMSRLKQAVQNGSVDDAFEAAHALKGLCANLSIDSMSKMIVPMVEILRDRSMEGIPLIKPFAFETLIRLTIFPASSINTAP